MQFKVGEKLFELKSTTGHDVTVCSVEKLLELETPLIQAQLFSLHSVTEDTFQHQTAVTEGLDGRVIKSI